MSKKNETKMLSFWDHLDELRGYLFKIVLVTVSLGLIAFFFKDEVFDVLLAPKNDSFVTYNLFKYIGAKLSFSQMIPEAFSVSLINTALAEQFIIHMKASIYVGFLCASPYILYLIFKFVSPALYSKEKRYAVRMVSSGYVMFMSGVALSYFLIFPLTFRFLGTYQVSPDVENLISLQSYMDTLMMMNLMMGIVFEIPILCWLLAKFGFILAEFMKRYCRHAIVIILVVAAVITPISDVFTLLLVSLPMWILYELSILIVKRTKK